MDKYTQAIFDIMDALNDDPKASFQLTLFIESKLEILDELIGLAKEVGIVEEVDD